MQILMISLDKGLLDGQNQASDSRERHLRYARFLEEKQPGSHLHILVRGGETAVSHPIASNLTLHPTQSILPHFLKNGLAIAHKIYNQSSIDLITTQSPFWDGVLGVWLSKHFQTPLLVQLHLSSLGSPQWLKASPLNRLRYFIGKYVLRRASAIRVVSKAAENWLIDSLNIAPEKVNFLPVTAVSLQIDPTIPKHPQPTILYIGRLSHEKGVDILLDAFQNVLLELPNAQLHIIGDGPDRNILTKQAHTLNISQQTHFLGPISPHQIGAHYQKATVLALPSRHESFGRVIIEAFTVGLPVVATQTEGAKFLIRNDENGLMVPVGDKQQLAKMIIKVCSNPNYAAKLGEMGQATSKAYLDIEAQTQALITFWESTLH